MGKARKWRPPKTTERTKALRLIARGLSDREAARRIGVDKRSIGRWRRAAGYPALDPAAAARGSAYPYRTVVSRAAAAVREQAYPPHATPPPALTPTPPPPSTRAARARRQRDPVRVPLAPPGSPLAIIGDAAAAALSARARARRQRSAAARSTEPAQVATVLFIADGPVALPGPVAPPPPPPPVREARATEWALDEHGRPRVAR